MTHDKQKGRQLLFAFMTVAKAEEVEGGLEEHGLKECQSCGRLWPAEQMEEDGIGPCCFDPRGDDND